MYSQSLVLTFHDYNISIAPRRTVISEFCNNSPVTCCRPSKRDTCLAGLWVESGQYMMLAMLRMLLILMILLSHKTTNLPEKGFTVHWKRPASLDWLRLRGPKHRKKYPSPLRIEVHEISIPWSIEYGILMQCLSYSNKKRGLRNDVVKSQEDNSIPKLYPAQIAKPKYGLLLIYISS